MYVYALSVVFYILLSLPSSHQSDSCKLFEKAHMDLHESLPFYWSLVHDSCFASPRMTMDCSQVLTVTSMSIPLLFFIVLIMATRRWEHLHMKKSRTKYEKVVISARQNYRGLSFLTMQISMTSQFFKLVYY